MSKLSELSLKPLEDALTKKFGVDIKLESEVKTNRSGQERMSFQSQDLKSMTGILEPIYEYLYITDFGSELVSKETGSYLWMSINITFQYVHGGSNGTNIGHCWYYFDTDEWKFDFNEKES